MTDFRAIADVSRSLMRLLQDRMLTGAAVTIAPPDQTVDGFDGARVNLYPLQVIENAGLKNDDGARAGSPGSPGRPPLWLNIRYMLTSHGGSENQANSDLNAQEILGDAMQVLHEYGNVMRETRAISIAPPEDEEPILVAALRNEVERIKLVLHPATLEDVTKVWSALSERNLRRSVFYEVTVVRIDRRETAPQPRPVEERRVFASLARRPSVLRVFVTPPPGLPETEIRARIGDEITIVTENANADRLYVRFGDLPLMRVPLPVAGRLRVPVPDDLLDIDFDPLTQDIIPPDALLQPGGLEIRLVAEHDTEGVAGALGPGQRIEEPRRFASNTGIVQIVPQITGVVPAAGDAATVLRVTGTRLWHPAAAEALVAIGDAAVRIRAPDPADPSQTWAAPTATAVEVPVAEAGLPVQAPADPPYPVAVIVDGARSRDSAAFHLDP